VSTAPSEAGDRGLPPLRRLPVPLTQPRPALRVVRDEPDAVPLAQGTLAFPLTEPDQHHDPDDVTCRDPENLVGGRGRVDATGATDTGATAAGVTTAGVTCAGVHRAGVHRAGVHPGHAPSPVLPEPRQWAAQFVQAAVEVTTGLRPPSQLVRWTNDEVRTLLVRRAELARRTPGRTRQPRRGVVRSTRVCIPCAGVAEATVVISDGPRVRAVALRMEGTDGRWRVTALRIC
jgi:Family of unknown function (DUF6459)